MLFIFCSSLFAKDNVDYEKDKFLIKARAYEKGQGVVIQKSVILTGVLLGV